MTLTALERELLGYVEQLAAASEVSAKALRDLEARSTKVANERLDGLADCIVELMQSQAAFTTAFQTYLTGSATYSQLRKDLNTSLEKLSAAEKKLKRR